MTLRFALPAMAALVLGASAFAQLGSGYRDAGETRTALAEARAQARAASARASRLEVEARATRAAAEKTAREAAAVAARIQQAEAQIAAARARIALARSERARIEQRLAERRGPLVRLTAGLQKLARRPLALAVLRPGSLRETVHLRAVLETTLPEVRRRTAALRGELGRVQAVEAEARAAYAALRDGERALADRRTRLATLETRQRLASRRVGGVAAREAERALALAEEARDLDALVARLDAAGTLRQQLAALPGPLLRPPRPGASEVLADASPADAAPTARAPAFQLPVSGRTVSGFGQPTGTGGLANGIALAPAAGALVVAPAAGRVAFAGPFRGFDRIVIVEHAGGFTSLVTGLARVDVAVGDTLVAGATLGVAGAGRPVVGFELRRAGEPVNPVDFLR
ncbi:peptidoglycan DD-metalloendopeptidase family protein [Tsuneonella sp. YG55]|uniref:Peptidoglycan DD-metalloendopeptidase family protein n=1 Tax=Tsuneonella litorea TaxID=2976475 RepID=A0A9X3A8G9_9SPHN|nr:peptidoglycan DD-metalloendopeptidase family protein [Tsuneonella litorea]MCT2557820.1 peptidoglycan DD-metalloendopeptidase family protein [Tsuneonella litorea]